MAMHWSMISEYNVSIIVIQSQVMYQYLECPGDKSEIRSDTVKS